jgi:hypothetical protein
MRNQKGLVNFPYLSLSSLFVVASVVHVSISKTSFIHATLLWLDFNKVQALMTAEGDSIWFSDYLAFLLKAQKYENFCIWSYQVVFLQLNKKWTANK